MEFGRMLVIAHQEMNHQLANPRSPRVLQFQYGEVVIHYIVGSFFVLDFKVKFLQE